MEVQVAHRRHRHLARLQWEPSAAANADSTAINRVAEDGANQRYLASSQRSFAADWTGVNCG
jgi:hypothetical protein